MNTTDRSIAPLDSALRRRFVFKRLEPLSKSEIKDVVGEEELILKSIDLWNTLNKKLEDNLGKDALLGHSYLMQMKEIIDKKKANSKQIAIYCWQYSIFPQLTDILMNAAKEELISGADAEITKLIREHPLMKLLFDQQKTFFVQSTGKGLLKRASIEIKPINSTSNEKN